MSTTSRVDNEVYAALLETKHEIERATGQCASISDAIRRRLIEADEWTVYELWQRDRLVGECRDRGLMVVGSKARLVDRLRDDDRHEVGL